MSRIIEKAAQGEKVEDEVFENELYRLDEEEDQADDILLIQSMPGILKAGFEELPSEATANGWRWQWTEITSGRYPLDKLPDHVRDIAEALYYLKNAPKVKSA